MAMLKRAFISVFVWCFALGLVLPLNAAGEPMSSEVLLAERTDQAIGTLRNYLQNAPNDAEAHISLLRAYLSLQRWDAAVAEGEKAISLAPNESEYHLWLGRAYGEKANHSSWTSALFLARKTRDEFERAVALNGRNAGARSDLAEYYMEAPSFLGGSKEKAAAEAEALDRQGEEVRALWIRAKLAENSKNYALAEQELRAEVQAGKGNPEPMLDLASFYRRRGRLNDAEAMVNQAVEAATKNQSLHVLYDAAQLLYLAGRNLNGAVDMLRNYISAASHSEQAPLFRAHYLLGNILAKMGNKPAAAEQYRAALSLASDFGPAQAALKKIQ